MIESSTLSATDRCPPTSKKPKHRFEARLPLLEWLVHLAMLLALFLVVSARAVAQTPALATPLRLSDYVGTYSDSPGHTLEIVAGDGLFAVLDEAKYSLHAVDADEFATITGEKIPFRRDSAGNITGYEEHGTFHPRTIP